MSLHLPLPKKKKKKNKEKKMSKRRRDEYTPIAEAMSLINNKVNLIGLVLQTGFPKKSKGTDFFCLVKIIDESYPSGGLSVNIFTETMDKLPVVLNGGDIILLSQVVMKVHESVVYAVFNKKFSSFALFDGKLSTSFLPYQCYSIYLAKEQDKKFILGLRKWLVHHPTALDSSDFQSLKDIREGGGFNLLCKLRKHIAGCFGVLESWLWTYALNIFIANFDGICKILRVWEIRKDEWMLLVWDGTDTPPVAINAKLEDEMDNPLPLESVPVCLPRDILCNLPRLGTVLTVTLDCGNEKLGVNVLGTNRWVKFDNLRCQLHASLWNASLLPITRFCYLRDEDHIVLQRMREHKERSKSKWGWMPLSSLPWPSHVTVTDHPDVPFVSLMRALANPRVVGKFRCVVRVVASFPWSVEEYRSPSGIYRIRLTLEDPTARIHAYLYAEDAEHFFGRYPSFDVLKRKRNLLLGISESDGDSEMNETSRNPPWIICCLFSYPIDENDVWGSRNFRIFATILLG
ncbi:protection of telomeres protein 1b-like isoform X2 [Lycium ferocissimum]|uniref:protection of telomeres protein 1b-like isoform X2 n=1 Tax=Lycium ferocissimum TaxID=112874 RepID=UPI0028152977|nr:protection of telomeres protein 1b-like isoform X2 [Lycium ferocissimum]